MRDETHRGINSVVLFSPHQQRITAHMLLLLFMTTREVLSYINREELYSKGSSFVTLRSTFSMALEDVFDILVVDAKCELDAR